MEVLNSRVIIRPRDHQRSVEFYRDVLGLSVFREFSSGGVVIGTVFRLGASEAGGAPGGYLELSGSGQAGSVTTLWLQVHDLESTFDEVTRRGAPVIEPFGQRPWGLYEGWVADPDGNRIALIEAPPEHDLHHPGQSAENAEK